MLKTAMQARGGRSLSLALYPPLRRIALPLLRMFGPGDIRIKHHWWPEARVQLDCYRHKGYWFYGRDRERDLMERLAELVGSGDLVIDVGGHIGYVALRLRALVGSKGRVIVFEPGPNNLPYLRTNLAPYPNMEVVGAACSDRDGEAEFWLEDLSGQKNTLLGDDPRGAGCELPGASRRAKMRPIRTPTVRLDTFLARSSQRPAVIKIDAEGAELMVLRGAAQCIDEYRPVLVVEVTANRPAVEEFLRLHHYTVRDPNPHGWICLPAEIASIP